MACQDDFLDVCVQYNNLYLSQLLASRKRRLLFAASPKLRTLLAKCETACSPKDKNAALTETLNAFENHPTFKAAALLQCVREDMRVLRRQWRKRARQDHSDAHAKDYAIEPFANVVREKLEASTQS
jgi:hypothetical protein